MRVGHKKIFCQRIDTTFDVTSRRGRIAGKHVAKVSLRLQKDTHPLDFWRMLQKKPPVCHGYHSTVNGSVSVGMILHRLTNDIRHLLKATIVHLKQRVHNAPLHRL